MDGATYRGIEGYMHECMRDAAHDREHVYRVLYAALDIAATEAEVDVDILIAASLLHDIGREAQARDPGKCHAQVGGRMACDFLLALGWPKDRAEHVSACVASHRFRSDDPPVTIEAKILFDADKLEAAGALGIARTLIYSGQVGEPLYTVDEDGEMLISALSDVSFVCEYQYKLKGIYGNFYTKRAQEIGEARRATATAFFEGLISEIESVRHGKESLERAIIT